MRVVASFNRMSAPERWNSVMLVGVMAMGLALTTAIFTVVDGVLLKPLPLLRPEELFIVGPQSPFGPAARAGPMSAPMFVSVRDAIGSDAAFAYTSGSFGASSPDDAIRPIEVTSGFFETLGISPVIGRALTDEDEVRSEPRNAVIGHALWVRQFGASRDALGKPVRLGDHSFTVVGVLPPGVDVPGGTNVWAALRLRVDDASARFSNLMVIARLPPNRQSLKLLADALTFEPLRDRLPKRAAQSAAFLLITGGLCFLASLAHLIILQVTRLTHRAKDAGVRLALGAKARRVAWSMSVDFLAMLTISVVLAGALLPGVTAAVLSGLPAIETVGQPINVDYRALLFLAVLSMAAVMAVHVLTWISIRSRGVLVLLQGSRFTSTRRVRAFTGMSVSLQVAMIAMLIAVAIASWNEASHAARFDFGFDVERVVGVQLDAPIRIEQLPTLQRVFADRRTDSKLAIGVSPLGLGRLLTTLSMDRPAYPGDRGLIVGRQYVSRGFFETIGLPIHAGRDVNQAEAESGANVVIVSKTAARALGAELLGFSVYVGGIPYRVVGIADDLTVSGFHDQPEPLIYTPARRLSSSLVVKTTLASDLSSEVNAALSAADIPSRVARLFPAGDRAWQLAAPYRTRAVIAAFVVVSAAVLGLIGVHAVTREALLRSERRTAICLALGASPGALRYDMAIASTKYLIAGVGFASVVITGGFSVTQYLVPGTIPTTPDQLLASAIIILVASYVAVWWAAGRLNILDVSNVLNKE